MGCIYILRQSILEPIRLHKEKLEQSLALAIRFGFCPLKKCRGNLTGVRLQGGGGYGRRGGKWISGR